MSYVHTRVLYYSLFSSEDLNIFLKEKNKWDLSDSVGKKWTLCENTNAELA